MRERRAIGYAGICDVDCDVTLLATPKITGSHGASGLRELDNLITFSLDPALNGPRLWT